MSLLLSDSISDQVPVINSFFKSGASGCLSKDRYRPCEYLNSEYLDTPITVSRPTFYCVGVGVVVEVGVGL